MSKYFAGTHRLSPSIQEASSSAPAVPLLQPTDSFKPQQEVISDSVVRGGNRQPVAATVVVTPATCCSTLGSFMATTFGNDETPTEFNCRLIYSFIFVSSLILFMGGIVGFATKDIIVKQFVESYVIIRSVESPLYEAWVDPASQDIEQWRCFSFFNLTNPHSTWIGDEVANYVQIGPYCYKELLTKDRDSIRFSEDRKYVDYSYRNYFVFDAEKSREVHNSVNSSHTLPMEVDDTDEMVIINLGVFGLQYRFQDIRKEMGGIPKSIFCDILDIVINPFEAVSNTSVFVRRPVKEILWGYEDPIWSAVQLELSDLHYVASSRFLTEWNGSLPVPSPYSHRSGQMCPLWGDYENTCNSTVNMVTREKTGAGGYDSYKDLGQMTQWAGQRQLWWWGPELDAYTKGDEVLPYPVVAAPAEGEEYPNRHIEGCNDVVGTDAMRWGPVDVVRRDGTLTTFLDILWRSVDFTYEQDTEVKDIPTLRFVLSAESMDNSTKNKECFQTQHRGFFNFTRPLYGPLFAAKNMMLDTQYTDAMVNFTIQLIGEGGAGPTKSGRVPFKEYIDDVLGADSNAASFRARHDSYLDIHALTGATLNAMAQGIALTSIHPINIQGCPGSKFEVAKMLPDTMYPLVVVRRSYQVPDKLANEIKDKLHLIYVAEVLMGIATIGGAASAAVACILFLLRRRHCCFHAVEIDGTLQVKRKH